MKNMPSFRIISFILVAVLLATSVFVALPFALADDPAITAYYALKGYQNGVGPADVNWQYDSLVLKADAPFENSDDSFLAPTVSMSPTDYEAELTWDAIDGAASYDVNLFHIVSDAYQTFVDVNVTDTNYLATNLTQGDTFFAQVIALDSNGEKIVASYINQFVANLVSDVFVVLNDASNSSTYASTFPNTAASNATPDGAGISYETDKTKNITFNFSPVDLAEYESIGFYIDNSENATAYSYYGIQANGTTITNVVGNRMGATNVQGYKDNGDKFTIHTADWENNCWDTLAGDKGWFTFNLNPAVIGESYSTDSITLKSHGYFYASPTDNIGKTVLIDNLVAIKDSNLFARYLQSGDVIGSTTYKHQVYDAGIYDCSVFDADANTLKNDITGTGYTFNYTSTEGALRFNMVDTGANQIGAALKFTAPVDGLFDISSSFIINGNTEPLTAYYRVVKIDLNGQESVIWPENADWHTFNANYVNLNPYGDVRVVEANLKTGESARIEAYVKFTDGSGSVNAILASPAAHVVNRISDAKGTSTTYNFLDYDYNLNDADLTAGAMTMYPTENRINFETIDLTTNTVYPLNRFVRNWTYFAANTTTGDNAGYYFAPGYLDILAASTTRGVQMRITVPYDSTLVYKSPITDNNSLKYRVLVNGTVVYPSSASFGIASGALNISREVKKGDEVCIQFFTMSDNGRAKASLKAPTVTFTKGNTYNLSTGTKFNALLERPYDGEDYVGEYVATNGTVWDYETIDFATNTYLAADMFDYSEDNLLYNSVSKEAGFSFGESSLIAKIPRNKIIQLTNGYGVALAFKVPSASIYDISAPIKVLSGSGTVAVRVTIDGEVAWPVDTQWYTVENASVDTVINLPAQELQLTANQIVRIEIGIYEADSAMSFDLGQPMVVKTNNRVASEKGYVSIYSPTNYLPFYVANSYNGLMTDAYSRFNLNFFNVSDGTVSVADKYDTTAQNKYYADGIPAAYYLSNQKLEFETDGTYGAAIDFISSMNGSTVVGVTAPSGVEFAVLKNGEQIYPTDTDYYLSDGNIAEIPDVELVIGSVVTIKYKAAAGKYDISALSVAITGLHKDDNTPSGNVFYAVSADPYKGDAYKGPYEQSYDIWNFETVRIADGTTEPVNYYDSTGAERYVYNTNMLNTGYYLKDAELQAIINNGAETQHGTKVTLTIPYAESYEIQSAAKISTDAAVANIHVRILKNGENIWPTDTEWYSQIVESGENIDVPFIEATLQKGDEISFEMYADDIVVGGIVADSILLSYGLPKVNVCGATIFESPDATAKAYAFKDYSPYGTLGYNGTHILTGQNRWQAKGIDVNDGKFEVVELSTYMASWGNNLVYNSDLPSGVFYARPWLEGQLCARRVATQDPNGDPAYKTETYGFALVFNTPSDNTVRITGAPTLAGTSASHLAANAQVKFRVLHNDTTVWPLDGDWETLNVNNRASTFAGVELDLKLGDTVQYQYYIDEVTLSDSVSKITHQLELGLPSAVVVQPSSKEKSTYNAKSDFTTTYQISPYWKYQYALDKENPVWKDMEKWGSWSHWYGAGAYNFLALNSGGAWIINKNTGDRSSANFNGGGDDTYGMVAYKFINPSDGWLTLAAGSVSTNTTKAYARIVHNGDVVWPSGGGWQALENKATYDKMVFEAKEGDWLRFEMTIAEETIVDWEHSRVTWQPIIKYTDRDPAYTEEAGDIWDGVDLGLLEFFKTFNSEMQFDIDYLTHKSEAEAPQEIVSSEPNGHYEYVLKDNAGQQQQQQQQQQQIIRRKKVVVVSGGIPLWLIVVVACVALVLIGGAITLIVLKKKGIIFTPVVIADNNGDENTPITDQDNGSVN